MQAGQVLAMLQRSITPNAAMIDRLQQTEHIGRKIASFAMPRGASGQAFFGGIGPLHGP